LGSADSINLPPESVDVAFICDTYHHFEFPLKTMASLHRALKPGGRVVLIDFRRVEGESTEWILSHVRAGQEVFEGEVTQSGFRKVREAKGLLRENYFVVFEKAVASAKQFPLIKGFGGVVSVPQAVEQPRPGMKVVFDATADGPPAEVNKGLDRVARLLNLSGAAGLKATDLDVVVVLHGEATKAVLSDAAYRARFSGEANPNLPLLQQLSQAGVKVQVCGQALHYKGFAASEVAEGVETAAAALTVIIHKQADGYSYVPVH
jgi:intracellular sulfur oxidation DsrE/DsrF family protein